MHDYCVNIIENYIPVSPLRQITAIYFTRFPEIVNTPYLFVNRLGFSNYHFRHISGNINI